MIDEVGNMGMMGAKEKRLLTVTEKSWTCPQKVYTPIKTNVAGWKMDPDWVDVFSIEN